MPTPTPTASAEIAEGAKEAVGFLEKLWSAIVDVATGIWEALPTFLVNIAICVVVWLVARWVIRIISNRLAPLLKDDYKLYKDRTTDQIHRTRSIATLMRSVARYLIYFIAICVMMSVLGVGDAGAIVAGAGIGSVAIGFGAQNFVKDVISGMFMVFENQYSVGDYVKLSTSAGMTEGTIEAIAIRVTYMRNMLGQQYIIPNGSIDQVVNCTRGNWLASVEVPIAYEEDVSSVIKVLEAVATEVAESMPEYAAGKPDVRAVESFGDSAVMLKVVCLAKPTKHWALERKMRLRIKEVFDELGIEIPYSKLVVQSEGAPTTEKSAKIDRFLIRSKRTEKQLFSDDSKFSEDE